MFLSSWVTEVVQSRSEALNVPLGKFCLQPHFRIQKSGDPFATPENAPITNLWKGTHSKDPRCENETQYRPRWLNSRLLPGGTEHSNQSPRTGSSVEQGQDTQQGENSHGWLEDSSGHVCAYSTSDPGTDLLIECGALWEPAVGTMATTQLQGDCFRHYKDIATMYACCPSLSSDIPHVQDLPTMTLPLYDFLPQLPQFTMTRRKN